MKTHPVEAEDESDYSPCASEDQPQDWDSPSKDIDLTASEDILCDEVDNEDDQLPYSQTSSCSNHSEGEFTPWECFTYNTENSQGKPMQNPVRAWQPKDGQSYLENSASKHLSLCQCGSP